MLADAGSIPAASTKYSEGPSRGLFLWTRGRPAPYPGQLLQLIDNCSVVAIVTQARYGNWAIATQR